MKKTILILTSLFLFGIAFTQKKRPNVIIIYTDDHGYADLGIQGQEKDLKTPNIDKLAAE